MPDNTAECTPSCIRSKLPGSLPPLGLETNSTPAGRAAAGTFRQPRRRSNFPGADRTQSQPRHWISRKQRGAPQRGGISADCRQSPCLAQLPLACITVNRWVTTGTGGSGAPHLRKPLKTTLVSRGLPTVRPRHPPNLTPSEAVNGNVFSCSDDYSAGNRSARDVVWCAVSRSLDGESMSVCPIASSLPHPPRLSFF